MNNSCLDGDLSISFLLKLYLKYQHVYFKRFVDDLDITVSHVPIIIMLHNHDYIYQKDLADVYKIDNAALTRLLRKLEDEGYIIREEDDENRRQNKIKLSQKGTQLASIIHDETLKRENEIMKGVSVSREELISILREVIDNSIKFNEENL